MTTIPMPEPVAWASKDLRRAFCETEMQALEREGGSREVQLRAFPVALITTTQAEAYNDACVREALVAAENALDDLYTEALNARVPEDEDDEAWNLTCLARAQSISQAQLNIRALIPPLPGPATETEEKS